MLKYLIIPLSSNAISFCHYNVAQKEGDFISPDILKSAIKWGMMENLSIQFVYPSVELPHYIDEIVETIDHTKILPADYPISKTRQQAPVVVFDSWKSVQDYELLKEQTYIIRTKFKDLLKAEKEINRTIQAVNRVNIVITDIDSISEDDARLYKPFLDNLVPVLIMQYLQGHSMQFNLITDRAMIKSMNNCNAGVESIAISTEGDFYICPGFSNESDNAVGSLTKGLSIRNQQLFEFTHAPICRICDAFQCKRCVWLNKRLTHEVNTPGRMQCVLSHIERNASKKFLDELQNSNVEILHEMFIPEIDYLDPFDKIVNI